MPENVSKACPRQSLRLDNEQPAPCLNTFLLFYLDELAIFADLDLNLLAVWFFYLGFINGNSFAAIEMKDSNLLYFRFLLNFLDFSAACVIELSFSELQAVHPSTEFAPVLRQKPRLRIPSQRAEQLT